MYAVNLSRENFDSSPLECNSIFTVPATRAPRLYCLIQWQTGELRCESPRSTKMDTLDISWYAPFIGAYGYILIDRLTYFARIYDMLSSLVVVIMTTTGWMHKWLYIVIACISIKLLGTPLTSPTQLAELKYEVAYLSKRVVLFVYYLVRLSYIILYYFYIFF